MSFDRITIIFNPNSTGDAPRLARELHEQIGEKLPQVPADLVETQHAGHAEELARTAAAATKRPLVISVSGDGGYHEVVNGVMAAGNPHAAAAVLGAGNANDHRTATRERPLIEAILAGATRQFDLLKVEVAGGPTRYAHSYLGLGISPVVAVELNRHSLNALKEMRLVMDTFRQYQPFQLHLKNRVRTIDSLTCGNIPRMAKHLKLSRDGRPDDGRFEVVIVPARSRFRLILTALRLVLLGPALAHSRRRFAFTTVTAMPMQLDGEIVELRAHTAVTVTSAHRVLTTLV